MNVFSESFFLSIAPLALLVGLLSGHNDTSFKKDLKLIAKTVLVFVYPAVN